jgi:hypothetical protein
MVVTIIFSWACSFSAVLSEGGYGEMCTYCSDDDFADTNHHVQLVWCMPRGHEDEHRMFIYTVDGFQCMCIICYDEGIHTQLIWTPAEDGL